MIKMSSLLTCTSLLLMAVAGTVLPSAARAAEAGQTLWSDAPARPTSNLAPQAVKFRPLSLNVAGMQALLAATRSGGSVQVALPRPDGGFDTFEVSDSHTLPPVLQQQFPQIISLAGRDAAGNPVRIDSSSRGFQAMVFGKQGIWVVRPESFGLASGYMSFFKADLPAPERMQKEPDVVPGMRKLSYRPSATPPLTNTGATQRNYRLAMAADGEYVTAVCGGTPALACGLAGVTQAVNRVNQVYETELGVHLTLIGAETAIIYTNSATDPYANDSSDLSTNQTNLDSVIGSSNYDVGHVFTTGSGGIAGLGVTCTNGQKGRGTTGLPNPTGDAFYIDYVAHELGHQFGGNHPFNSETDGCSGGTRNPDTAYESGSGSTIQAYAGICGVNNLQPHTDPYFHAISLSEIETWIDDAGGNCAASSASTDAAPAIDAGSLPAAGLTIPMHTPFTLSASASDTDSDALTYTWEQFDLGNATDLSQGDTGNGPIFRSRPPTTSGSQTFPAMASVLSGTLDPGDAWPVTNRTLNFRLTVRDNHGVPGTPQYGRTTGADAPAITVTTAAGPFVVTQPNTAVTWPPNSTQTVMWDVAGTNQAPVNCTNVTLRLSTDSGVSFPTVLVTGVANDGNEQVTIPATASTTARVQITCDNNIFFDVSDVDFTIAALADKIFANGFENIQTLQDPGFEATTVAGGSNPNWQGTDTHNPGGTPFLNISSGSQSHSGDWAIWFGGWGTAAAYTQSATQSVVLQNAATLYLTFWRKVAQLSIGLGDVLTVSIDGTAISTIDASTLTVDSQFKPVSIDISAYADGATHTVEFHFAHATSGDDADIFIDDTGISLTPLSP